jgi:hypothetical protein
MPEFADSIEWWGILAIGLALFWLVFELGFRQGRRRRDHAGEDEKSQLHAISAALLGLLGLLLAFSLDMVDERFQARKMLVVREANAIGTTFLRAGMIPEPHRTAVRELLRQYVNGRLGVGPENFEERLQQATAVQDAMWTHAEAVGDQQPESEIVSLFVESLNHVIDLHQERLTHVFQHRLPITMLGALLIVSVLAIGGLGYSSSLADSRLLVPTFLIILAIVVVEIVIIDLDRPLGGLFQISQDAMVQLQESLFNW